MIDNIDSFFMIEQTLYKTRLMSNTSLRNISSKETGLNIVVMYRIEKHQNYHISSLLKYAKVLNRNIYADDVLIDDVTVLGELLKSKRQALGLSIFKASLSTGLIPKSILKIEHGKEYNKTTLVKYLSFFTTNFTIK